MAKLIRSRNGRWFTSMFFLVVSLAILFFALSANRLRSATPASGTLDPNGPNTSQSWSGAVVAPAGSDIEPSCVDGVSCDTYTVTLSGSPSNWLGKRAHIVISWNFNSTAGDDFDVVIHKGSNAGPVVASAFTASSTQPEVLDIDPNASGIGTGVFTVHVIYFTAVAGDTYNGTATVTGGFPTPTPTPIPAFAFTTPQELTGHPPSPAFFQGDGEPEIKIDIFGNIYATAIQGVPEASTSGSRSTAAQASFTWGSPTDCRIIVPI